ncbi:hypothetical protein [Plasmodium yoelii yoelii]|uniref:Uncharacterized protein n=1 Tax=Plasmodium yoelii yoelii TaxID=73239 RepID=Q7RQH2_PLAYO|nr:hypothetical protein [Plasmodium yoelii yoelii]
MSRIKKRKKIENYKTKNYIIFCSAHKSVSQECKHTRMQTWKDLHYNSYLYQNC